jgi:GT2 family glycosyltransferase
MDISVILVSYNTAEITIKSLQHLYLSSHELKMEVVIVDNASRDNSVELISENYPEIPLIKNKINVK